MEPFDKIIQSQAERLYGDERLRSHFTDAEAKIVLSWAETWIATQVRAAKTETQARQIAQSEFTRAQQTISALNTLAAKPGALKLSDAVATLSIQPPLSRENTFKLLTEIITTLWRMQAMPTPAQSATGSNKPAPQ